jgi:radical SAM superfamily enzyme YgiQ (UPF0313 family)
MNILLVYPVFPRSFWSFAHALEIYGRKALLPPLGLVTVAAMLPQPWGKRVVDMNVRPLTDDDLRWADWVFVSGMAVQRASAHEVTARCKAMGKPVIGGGPLFDGEYALFTDVEHFVLGEAEPTVAKLVADMEAQAAGTGKVRRIYRSRDYADMTKSPVPLWELLDLHAYGVMGIQYTRGCPYDCEFCNVTALLGRKPRVKKPGQILAELDALKAAGWKGGVFFVDDNLIGHRPAIKGELLPALIDWQKKNGPVSFQTQLTINLADDPDLLEMLTDAGFDTVFVGIETPDPESLKECKKTQNRNRDLVDDVKTLQRAGIEVQAGFIVGFDHDSDRTFDAQVDFIQRSGIVTAMVGQLHAPPGTRLVTRLWQEGRLRGHSSGNNTDGTTNILPKMGVEPLRQGYFKVLRGIFSPAPCYARIRTFLRAFGVPKVRRKLDRRAIGTFFRACWRLGIVGKERFHYWGLLFWTLFTRPTFLPMAVHLATLGHHYRRMYEEISSRPLAEPLMLVEEAVKARAAAGVDAPVQLTVSAHAHAAADV